MRRYRPPGAKNAKEPAAPKEAVGLRLETHIVDRLDLLARHNHRSRTGEVSALIDAAFRAAGLDVGVLGE